MKWIVLVAVLVAAFVLFKRFTSGGEAVAPADFAERPPDALVLDVRTPREYAEGHVAGAVNVNILEPGFKEAVEGYDRQRPVYLYCGSGQRSGRAAKVMEDMGFQTVRNAGGFGALVKAGAAVE